MKSSIVVVAILALATWVSGCSSSNTGSNNGTLVGTGVVTNCTTTGTGTTQTCIPTLGNYGSNVTFQGQITNITQTGGQCNGPCAGATLLHDYVGPANSGLVPSYSTISNNSYLTVNLQESSQGPSISMYLQIANFVLQGNNLAGYGVQGIGFTQFTQSASNPAAGIMELDPFLISGTDPVDVDSLTQPWDGSKPLLTGLTVTIGGVYFGTINLNY